MSDPARDEPAFGSPAFRCPYCATFSTHEWLNVLLQPKHGGIGDPYGEINVSRCNHCGEGVIWRAKELLFPYAGGIAPANPDLSDDIRHDYDEAAAIVNRSPRGAAALLRVAIQKLCCELGQGGQDLNADVRELVANGLSTVVQQALDVVRVIGNEAVHPGVIDLRDDRETALSLFDLVNMIAQKMIAEPKRIDEMYQSLPEGKLGQIRHRDQKSSGAKPR